MRVKLLSFVINPTGLYRMNQLSVDLHCIGLDLAGMTQVVSFLQSGRSAHTPAAIKENPSIDFIVQSPYFLMVPVSNLAMV